LSSRIPIAYVDIRVFAHATEDQEKVLKALRNTLSTELIEKITLKQSRLTGHHGNPIVLFETKVKEKDVAEAFFKKLSSSLECLDKELLSREIEQHVDKGNLYIRLDKQSAFLNKFKIGSVDPIRLRVHFKKHSLEEIVDICRKSGMLP
jgi:RNA binding exosome subunit